MTRNVDDLRSLRAGTERWMAADPDDDDRAELRALLADLDRSPEVAEELRARFSQRLTFGTAGLRGPLRAGPNGMNTAVVRAAAAGLCAYLDDAEHQAAGRPAPGPVVIGYDARHRSAEFAAETGKVVTGTGRTALILPGPLPTPVLAFAVRHLNAAAGVMVTASHNPPTDNGYKVYDSGGVQIVPPADALIETAIRAVGAPAELPLGPPAQVVDVLDDYVTAVAALAAPDGPREVSVVHTALHGVGAETVARVLSAAGFAAAAEVPAQAEPDPRFPTVAFPNPEEAGATDLLLDLAAERRADVAIANDPDADRCAVAVPGADPAARDGWRLLTGDELGVLLADHLLTRGTHGTYATTIVSSPMLGAMAAEHAMPYAETLTGFKWIMRAADQTGVPVVFGYEEALGYAVAPSLVTDKDGVSAALLVAELAAAARAAGRRLTDRLDQLAIRHGVHATGQFALRVADLDLITTTMRRLRACPPTALAGHPVIVVQDRLPEADVLTLHAEGDEARLRLVIRPSGTEPKLKAYLAAIVPVAAGLSESRKQADTLLARLRAECVTLFGG